MSMKMPDRPESETKVLSALKGVEVSTEVDLQTQTYLSMDELHQAISRLSEEGLVEINREKFPEYGGLVGLTIKGLKNAG